MHTVAVFVIIKEAGLHYISTSSINNVCFQYKISLDNNTNMSGSKSLALSLWHMVLWPGFCFGFAYPWGFALLEPIRRLLGMAAGLHKSSKDDMSWKFFFTVKEIPNNRRISRENVNQFTHVPFCKGGNFNDNCDKVADH